MKFNQIAMLTTDAPVLKATNSSSLLLEQFVVWKNQIMMTWMTIPKNYSQVLQSAANVFFRYF